MASVQLLGSLLIVFNACRSQRWEDKQVSSLQHLHVFQVNIMPPHPAIIVLPVYACLFSIQYRVWDLAIWQPLEGGQSSTSVLPAAGAKALSEPFYDFFFLYNIFEQSEKVFSSAGNANRD